MKTKTYRSVTLRHSVEISTAHQLAKTPIKKLVQLFPQYSPATIYRHAQIKIGEDQPLTMRNINRGGRPRKLSNYQKRTNPF